MKTLMISGETGQLTEWNINDILESKDNAIERMLQYDWDNKVSKYSDGMTYLEIEQFNNTFNNFR